mmetsp:Transcript_17291/g.43139  ORF Transcript_17291/g.43139 Transcript_17291/m.43139 type:complete len:90 (-) Transcript_17291:2280-2549(-)
MPLGPNYISKQSSNSQLRASVVSELMIPSGPLLRHTSCDSLFFRSQKAIFTTIQDLQKFFFQFILFAREGLEHEGVAPCVVKGDFDVVG